MNSPMYTSNIRNQSTFIESEEFCNVLSLWLGEQLSGLACQRLLLRLDEKNTGCVTYSTFQGFVRQGNLRETVNLYASGNETSTSQIRWGPT